MSDKRVQYREFVRHPGKYIIPGETIIIDGRDKNIKLTIQLETTTPIPRVVPWEVVFAKNTAVDAKR